MAASTRATLSLVGDEDSSKRRQILDGARKLFLDLGFDAASMGEIARAAGVSKGTLYVYFDSKEHLFEAIVEDERGAQAEQIFALDAANHDVAAVLTGLGTAYVRFLCQPAACSAIRTVVAIAERMPELGRKFYEFGPMCGIERLAAYLKAQCDSGVLAIEDCEIAAAQFLDTCQSTLFKPVLFGSSEPPTDARVEKVVGTAVRTFLKAYKPQ
jgi:AcrR family transcriptional regulator